MTFEGFTFPEGAWLPPELLYLLPDLSGSQLKVTIAVLYHNMQVGGSENLSLTDIQHFTGLTRHSVTQALAFLLNQKILDREQVDRSYTYFPMVRFSDYHSKRSNHRDQRVSVDSSVPPIKTFLTDSLSKDSAEKIELIKKLRSAGIYLKTAQQIVCEYEAGQIDLAFRYFRHALASNLAQGPGWLVSAIRERWDAPLGWVSGTNGSCICNKCSSTRTPNSEETRVRYQEWNND